MKKLYLIFFSIFIAQILAIQVQDNRASTTVKEDFLVLSKTKPSIYFSESYDIVLLGQQKMQNLYRISVKENSKNKMIIENGIVLQNRRTELDKKSLVIYAETYEETMLEYLFYQELQGFEVASEALPFASTAQIQNIIENYIQQNGYPTVLFFVGDTTQIPQQNNSDVSYALGSDNIPDFAVSRWNVSSSEELQRQIAKATNYRTLENNSWQPTALFTAAAANSTTDQQLQNTLMTTYFSGFETENIYFNQASTTYQEAFSNGLAYLLHQGYGSEVLWLPQLTTTDVQAFSNTALPFVGSFCDQSGTFSSSSMRTAFQNQENGSLAFLGCNTTLNNSYHQKMEEAFVQALFSNTQISMGEAFLQAQLALIEMFGMNTTTLSAILGYQLSGDPALLLKTNSATISTVEVPTTINANGNTLSFQVEACKGGVATLHSNQTIIAQSSISETGYVTLNWDSITTPISLTLSAQNLPIFTQNMAVEEVETGTLDITQTRVINLNGETVSALQGSSSYYLEVIVQNNGSSLLTEGSIELACASEGILLQASVEMVSDLDAESTEQILFSFETEAEMQDTITFFITSNYNGNFGYETVEIDASSQPELTFSHPQFSVQMNANSSIDRILTIENSGYSNLDLTFFVTQEKAATRDAFGYTSEVITFSENDFPWEDISATGTAIELTENGVSDLINLDFRFPYYDELEEAIRIDANGLLWLGDTAPSATNGRIPSTTIPNSIIAPFWDDLKPIGGDWGTVYFQQTETKAVIQFQAINHAGNLSIHKETFAVHLYETGQIEFYYKTVSNPNSCTVGIENHDGTMGEELVYNGDFLQEYMRVRFNRPSSWLTLSHQSITISAQEQMQLNLTMDSTTLIQGDYQNYVHIQSNDPNQASVYLPVHLSVVSNIDVNPPTISHTALESTDNTLARLVSATISDENGIAEARLFWKTADGNFDDVLMIQNGLNFEAMLPAQADLGRTISYYIWAKDTFANQNQTRVFTYDIALPSPDNIQITGEDGFTTVQWDAVNGAEFYKIYVKTSPTGNYELLTTTSQTQCQHHIEMATNREAQYLRYQIISVSTQ